MTQERPADRSPSPTHQPAQMRFPGAPMDPEQAARNRRIILAVGISFILVSLTVLVWGFFVTARQREVARSTDRALRSAAWTILCYAQQHEGQFPTDARQLDGVSVEAPTGGLATPGHDWPISLQQAMGGEEYVPFARAKELVSVTWPPHGGLAPVLGVRSNLSGRGTVEMVNQWITAFAQRRASGE